MNLGFDAAAPKRSHPELWASDRREFKPGELTDCNMMSI
jgi:hypothetical protein